MIKCQSCQFLSKHFAGLTRQELCFQAKCCDSRLHFTHFSFTVQLPVRRYPTVVVGVVGGGLSAFRKRVILHRKYYARTCMDDDSVCQMNLSVSVSVLLSLSILTHAFMFARVHTHTHT